MQVVIFNIINIYRFISECITFYTKKILFFFFNLLQNNLNFSGENILQYKI